MYNRCTVLEDQLGEMDKKAAGKPVVLRPMAKSRHEPGTRMSVLLSNPDYLLEGYAEKRCQYIGVMEDIPTATDMSSRGYLLAALDDKRNHGKLPWMLTRENDVTITLSAYNVKIIKEDRTGTILHRIPIHEIASASYVNDDDQHLLFIKAGDARQPCCPCHVLSCAKRADAEEMCTILQQAFQLVYTEATMEHLAESINAGEKGRGSMLVPAPISPIRKQMMMKNKASFEDGDSDEGVSAEQLVQEYMERLHKLLDFKELGEFANLLKRYRDDLPVEEFLTKLSGLYGDKRKFLIPGMNPFIPEEDKQTFEKFLSDHNLESATTKRAATHPQAVSPSPTKGGRKQRESGRKGHSSHVADIDKFLHDIDYQMDSVLEDTTDF